MTQSQDVKNAVDISAIGANLTALTATVEALRDDAQDRTRKQSEDHRAVMAKFDDINKILSHQQGFINAVKYVAAPAGALAFAALAWVWNMTGGQKP